MMRGTPLRLFMTASEAGRPAYSQGESLYASCIYSVRIVGKLTMGSDDLLIARQSLAEISGLLEFRCKDLQNNVLCASLFVALTIGA